MENQPSESIHEELRIFSSLECRLKRDPATPEEYVNFMNEYERLNPMMEVKVSSVPRSHYFILHHCVLKPDSSTAKLRVVFDASAPSSTGKSLNNILRVMVPNSSVRVHSRRGKNVSTDQGSS